MMGTDRLARMMIIDRIARMMGRGAKMIENRQNGQADGQR